MDNEDRQTQDLVDEELLAEIELVSDLVMAAADRTEHLTQEQIDKVLGL